MGGQGEEISMSKDDDRDLLGRWGDVVREDV